MYVGARCQGGGYVDDDLVHARSADGQSKCEGGVLSVDNMILIPEKPPIAEHPIWSTLHFNLQAGSLNQRRIPLHRCLTPNLGGARRQQADTLTPLRDGSMFLT